jgi:hypothetical protein
VARPKKPIDPAEVEKLAAIGCPPDEIAACLDTHERTIQRRFATLVKNGHKKCQKRVRSILFKQAVEGNTAAAIFLAKAICGWKEHGETVINVSATATGGSLQFSVEDRKRLEDLAATIQQRVFKRSQTQTHELAPSGNGDHTQN